MRILQVCPFSLAEVGGVSEHVQNISVRLAKEHDVTAYVTDSRKQFPRYELINGVETQRFRRYAPSDAYFFSWDMLLALRKADFDIVHGHCYHAFPMHFARLAKCEKFIVTTHFHGVGHSPFRNSLVRLVRAIGKSTLDKADKIVAVSDYERVLIHRQFKLDSDRVAVIPNGINMEEFSGLKRQRHDLKQILFVGNLHKFKGAHYLIEVLPRLGDDVVLEIVGRGPIKQLLKRRAEKLRVENRVSFSENLSRRELLQKYVDADVFVLLSMYEAYSLVVAEALAAGTPCIVANTSALSEWIDNETCFGVDFPVNLKELAKQINNVLDNAVNKIAMEKWIGTKILDWDDVVRQLEKVYIQ